MPRSSISLTSDDSLKRGGGWVKCCSGSSSSERELHPLLQRREQPVLGLLGLRSPARRLAGLLLLGPASSSGGFAPYTAR